MYAAHCGSILHITVTATTAVTTFCFFWPYVRAPLWPTTALHGPTMVSLRPTSPLLLTSAVAAQQPPPPTVPPLPLRAVDLLGVTSRFHGLRFVPAPMRWPMVGTGILACKSVSKVLLCLMHFWCHVQIRYCLRLFHVGSLHTVLFHRQCSADKR